MSRSQDYRCEVCGMQERDHSRWLLVSDQPRAHQIDILNWDDKLAAQPGICHLCCTDHLQVLVGSWMMPDLGIPSAPPSPTDNRSPLLSNFRLDSAYLATGDQTERESLLTMLEAVEVALRGADSDDEPAQNFDA